MRRSNVLLAVLLFACAQPGLAQTAVADGSFPERMPDREEREDEGNPRLGLLGLWGLAGLLGLLRRERNIHVDARRERRD